MRVPRSTLLRQPTPRAFALALLAIFATGALSATSGPRIDTLFQGTFDSAQSTIAADIGSISITGASNVQIAPNPSGGKLLQVKNNTPDKVNLQCSFLNGTKVADGPLTVTFEANLAPKDSPFDAGIGTDIPGSDWTPATGADPTNHLMLAGKQQSCVLPANVPLQFVVVFTRPNSSSDWTCTVTVIPEIAGNYPGCCVPYTTTLTGTSGLVSSFNISKKGGTPGTLSIDNPVVTGIGMN